MSSFRIDKAKAPLPRGAAASLWRNTLAQIPSVFGRLVYLASLRDPNSGLYIHHGLAAVFGDSDADTALRASHEETFAHWLELNLEGQKSDLELYLTSLEPEKKKVIRTWTRIAPYRNILPESVRDVENELFLADLESLLSLLRNELGVASPHSDA